ncbi:TetR family transcriptional regulator [Pseudoduganella sp. FT26W]|uniref:TetR family transcriptional regulator n=1 Tax=Duganella aquatilis TaxID=2666082 RepID=A0A844DFX9_9BURK|nr:TetR/AcrR family transcriptional regulator [Duganella aquatilis]MRW87530.1 TetR family transcriptional regulator [Duganella aquatilis]
MEKDVRKSNAEAAETRRRILATASGLFLKNGIAETAIADVMVAAGLTQGGFYRHFESKEHLVAEASSAAFDLILNTFDSVTVGKSPRDAVDLIVHCYLHQHQNPESSVLCPMANLSSEIRNADELIKNVVTEGYHRFVKMFAAYLIRLDYGDYMGIAEAIVAVLVGAVSLSRLTLESDLSSAILDNAKNTVNLILESATRGRDRHKATT